MFKPLVPVEDCKIEWAKLRNCYVNALRRRVSLQNRGGKTLPPWLYESEMNFLKPYMNGRGWDDTPYTILLPDHTYEIDHDATSMESFKDDGLDINESETKLDTKAERKRKKQKSPKIEEEAYEVLEDEEYKIINEDYKINDSYKIMNNNQGILNDMDESDLFFLGLSQTFKKLPKIDQCRLKMEIFKILNVAEMKQLESGQRKRKAPNRRSSSE